MRKSNREGNIREVKLAKKGFTKAFQKLKEGSTKGEVQVYIDGTMSRIDLEENNIPTGEEMHVNKEVIDKLLELQYDSAVNHKELADALHSNIEIELVPIFDTALFCIMKLLELDFDQHANKVAQLIADVTSIENEEFSTDEFWKGITFLENNC